MERPMPQILVIHENDAWLAPLRASFLAAGVAHEEWFLDRGIIDLTRPPPEGVYYNRMSASSHTRGHTYAPEYAGAVIEWLERHGRTVVNGRRALQLEVSKVAQYEALAAHGIPTPPTLAVGLVGESTPLGPAYGWGAIVAAVGLAWWWVFRRWRHPLTWLAGVIPVLLVLFGFFYFLERVLPAGY